MKVKPIDILATMNSGNIMSKTGWEATAEEFRKALGIKRQYKRIAYGINVIGKKDNVKYRIIGRSPVSNKIILSDENKSYMMSYYKLRKYYA